MIRKKYSNELLNTVTSQGFDISNFKFDRRDDQRSVTIESQGLKFHLKSSSDDLDQFDGFYQRFGSKSFVKFSPLSYVRFEEVVKFFKDWLEEVKIALEENMTPDYWAYVEENPLTIGGLNFQENLPFGIEEKAQLKLGLEEIKFFLKEQFDLNDDQFSIAEKKIDYLISAVDRLNKTDWKGIAISTVIGIAYDLSFDLPKQAKLMALFSKVWAIVQALPAHLN